MPLPKYYAEALTARQHLIENANAHFDLAVVTASLSRWHQVKANLHLQMADQAVPVAA